jgi:hypothetical protein
MEVWRDKTKQAFRERKEWRFLLKTRRTAVLIGSATSHVFAAAMLVVMVASFAFLFKGVFLGLQLTDGEFLRFGSRTGFLRLRY